MIAGHVHGTLRSLWGTKAKTMARLPGQLDSLIDSEIANASTIFADIVMPTRSQVRARLRAEFGYRPTSERS